MLKSFMVNEGVGAIEIEEKYETFVKELRTDRYVTATPLNWIFLASILPHLATCLR